MNKNTRLCFVCYMNEHVNICGNAPWSITPFSDFGQRPRRHPVDRISSAWVHALDIGLHCTLFTPVVRLTPKNIDFLGGNKAKGMVGRLWKYIAVEAQ